MLIKEATSSQCINFDRYEILFNTNVPKSKNPIQCMLGTREVDQLSKYLGVPTLVGKSKARRGKSYLKRWQKGLLKVITQSLP